MIRSAFAALAVALVLAGCLDSPKSPPSSTSPTAIPSAQVFRHSPGDPAVILETGPGTPHYRLTGFFGGEPSLGLTRDGTIFMASDGKVLRSRDLGETWTSVFDLGFSTREPVTGTYPLLDPWVWVDPTTDRVYNSPLYPPLTCNLVAWSDNGGDLWIRRDGACDLPVVDHQKLVTGIPPAGALPAAGVVYPNVVYICYNKGFATNCLTSFDGGLTYVDSIVIRDRAGCVNGKPAVSAKGVLALPSSGLCSTLLVSTSRDAGLSWATYPTTFETQGIDSNAAFGPDDTLYVGFVENGTDPHASLARSRDYGATWDANWTISPASIRSVAFTSVAAGDAGRLAYAFIGTFDEAPDPTLAPATTRWHLFITTIEGADTDEPTFTTYQVTPLKDPVQIGCIAMRSGLSECRNLIDFIDTAAGPDGTPFVAYTEGCTKGCAFEPSATASQSRDIQTALAWLDGWSLRAS